MKRLNLTRKILLIVLCFMVVSQLAYLYVNVTSFKRTYYEAVESNISTAGKKLSENLDYILGLGISIRKLVNIKPLLKDILSDAGVLKYVAIQDTSGVLLYYCDHEKFLEGDKLSDSAGTFNPHRHQKDRRLFFQLKGRGKKEVGRLIFGVNDALLAQKVKEIFLDSGTVILISLLAAFDFLFFTVAYTVSFPLKRAADQIRVSEEYGLTDRPVTLTGIDFLDGLLRGFNQFRENFKEDWQRLNKMAGSFLASLGRQGIKKASLDRIRSETESVIQEFGNVGKDIPRIINSRSPEMIRPAIFLFVFSEALTISFLPLYAMEIYRPILNISEDVIVGMPIVAFMLFMGISLPIGGAWSDRVGRKKAFLVGALISSIGLFLSGMATDVAWLIAYRSIAAVGYGIVFMTCQGYLVDTTTMENRAEGMAIFTSAFYGGSLCGSAIGGMVADRLGYSLLFYIGAAISVLSAFFIYMFISEKRKGDVTPAQRLKLKQWGSLFSDRNFLSLVFLQSIPSKICLIGLVYYVAPLFLKDQGNSQSDIGRIVMSYSLVMIFLVPGISRWADRKKVTKPFIFWGGLFSGISLMPLYMFQDSKMIALAIVMLGLSNSLSIPGQTKLATQLEVMRKVGVGGGFGVYRLAERTGNVIAPILIGVMASSMGFARSLALIGTYMALSSLLFLFACKEG